MSGTSLDGVDAALVDFAAPPGRLVASHFVPYPDAVRAEALALKEFLQSLFCQGSHGNNSPGN